MQATHLAAHGRHDLGRARVLQGLRDHPAPQLGLLRPVLLRHVLPEEALEPRHRLAAPAAAD
eukprot:1015536-Lingulodinium_polyedra.AAC.1